MNWNIWRHIWTPTSRTKHCTKMNKFCTSSENTLTRFDIWSQKSNFCSQLSLQCFLDLWWTIVCALFMPRPCFLNVVLRHARWWCGCLQLCRITQHLFSQLPQCIQRWITFFHFSIACSNKLAENWPASHCSLLRVIACRTSLCVKQSAELRQTNFHWKQQFRFTYVVEKLQFLFICCLTQRQFQSGCSTFAGWIVSAAASGPTTGVHSSWNLHVHKIICTHSRCPKKKVIFITPFAKAKFHEREGCGRPRQSCVVHESSRFQRTNLLFLLDF